MNYTRADLINALCAEWDYLCHDDFDPENDQTTEEYREDLQNYTLEELIEETSTGEGYTLDEWMENWGQYASLLKCPLPLDRHGLSVYSYKVINQSHIGQ